MAELSAYGDKFEAWENEPPSESPAVKRPPLGGRPPAMARGGNKR